MKPYYYVYKYNISQKYEMSSIIWVDDKFSGIIITLLVIPVYNNVVRIRGRMKNERSWYKRVLNTSPLFIRLQSVKAVLGRTIF